MPVELRRRGRVTERMVREGICVCALSVMSFLHVRVSVGRTLAGGSTDLGEHIVLLLLFLALRVVGRPFSLWHRIGQRQVGRSERPE